MSWSDHLVGRNTFLWILQNSSTINLSVGFMMMMLYSYEMDFLKKII